MTTVYLLLHVYQNPSSGEVTKTIGIYSSAEKAMAAAETQRKLPGFSDYPDGFRCQEVELDQIWPLPKRATYPPEAYRIRPVS
jgi:hypothetical protein